MFQVWKLVLEAISGYTWQVGNTYDDESAARAEAIYWKSASPQPGDVGYTPDAGYWSWNMQLGVWNWNAV